MRSRLGASLLLSAVVVPVPLAAQKPPKVAETAVVATPAKVAQVVAPAVLKPGWSYTASMEGQGEAMKLKPLSFQYEVKSPRDVATGQASGKRQYQPLIIVKEIDKSSPMLKQSLSTGEVIPSMTFVATGPNGVHHEVKLTYVRVASVQRVKRTSPSGDPHEYEEVSFTYEKIVFDNKVAKTMASEDWVRQN
ncbi:MAG: type VI secretion system tube protein Hcp [Gemmatimonadota bacterium]|nr:type VI secretion system tube protein Hcp [Gemmatimonadota bacterium]